MAAIRKSDLVRLSGSQEYTDYILKARKRFEKGQAATVQELRKVYRRAAESIRQDIQGLTPGTLQHAHLSALAKNLGRRSREMNKQVLDLAHKGIYMSVDTGTQAARDIAGDLLEDAWPRVEVARLFAPINERAVLALLSRTGKDGLKLSDRVWRIGEKYRKTVTRLVEDGVARGLDSRKLAREVQQYLEPGKSHAMKFETRRRLGVSKDISYEGMRLARTEMNNAFHESSIMANRANPGYCGVYWRLSSSHPVPDECDEMARHNGDGFYPKGEEPARPHPNCLCVVVPRCEDPEEFVDRLNEWMRNPKSQPDIEKWYKGIGDNGGAGALALGRPARPAGINYNFIREEKIYGLLSEKEAEIVGLPNERAYILTPAGETVFWKDGTRNRVDFTPEELAKMKGNILTHNHHNGWAPDRDDFNLAAANGLAEMRVVGPGVEYSIKPVNAWPELNDKTYHIIEKADRATRLRFTKELAFGRMTQEQANADHYHEVWTSTKDALGIEYRRTRK